LKLIKLVSGRKDYTNKLGGIYAAPAAYSVYHHRESNLAIVPDKRSRILEVVVVRRILAGYWEFGVVREWGSVEKGEVSLQAT
jgi:hypothetical protein